MPLGFFHLWFAVRRRWEPWTSAWIPPAMSSKWRGVDIQPLCHAGNGWVAGGCWDDEWLWMGMDWIIPSLKRSVWHQ